MAISIILVEMAVKCLFFFVCETQREDKDRATRLANLMSRSANITSAISYDKKIKPKPNHIVSFPNSSLNAQDN